MERHRLDVVSLVAGLIFLAVGIGHLLGINLLRLSLLVGLWPLLLIVGGGLLLAQVVRRPSDD
ncbi:MAG TPA: hypothetical protein VK875_06640 [Euzebyales bacterium]|nr:hypothetical protein [Euzebyales bacterium]